MPVYKVQQKPKHYQWLFALKLVVFLTKKSYHHLIFRNNREQSIAASISFFSRGKIKTHYFMEMALGGKRTQIFRTLRYAFISTWVCPLPYLHSQVLQQTRIAPSKVKEIPSGLNFNAEVLRSKTEARMQLQWPLDQKLILVVGRIDPKKRQVFVWDCFAQRTNPDEILIFVGESTPDEPSSYYFALQEKIKKHPKSKAVIWAGFQQNMPLIYQAADMVIMAADHETVGMVTIEALQFACPVVGANNGGTKDNFDRTGIKVDYTRGPLKAAFATTSVNTLTASSILAVNAQGETLGAIADANTKATLNQYIGSYNFGPATVAYLMTDTKATVKATGAVTKTESNQLTVSAPMGAFTLRASMGNLTTKTSAGTTVDVKGSQFGASYALSKRTNVYAMTGKTKDTGSSKSAWHAERSGSVIGLAHSF
jgi:glycosyltransferase involved in cell wall biosynthesis